MPRSQPPDLLRIPFESEDFPPSRSMPPFGELPVTWDDLLWAAVTLGRPNLHYVFRHGPASIFEAIFRWSVVRMALEQRGAAGSRLWRTDAFKRLDPTEKGAINYFLGMTVCKVFADKLLRTPWLLHLDVFRGRLNVRVQTGRSRPDLVGEDVSSGSWHAFESKGRASAPAAAEKAKAKMQAQRLVSVDGHACELHIGAISHFRNDVLHFYWRDPIPAEPRRLSAIEVTLPEDAWRAYFGLVAELVATRPTTASDGGAEAVSLRVDEADLSVEVHPKMLEYLRASDWSRARAFASDHIGELEAAGYKRDGLRVRSGPTWRHRLEQRSRPSTWWNLVLGLRWPRFRRPWVEVGGFRWWVRG